MIFRSLLALWGINSAESDPVILISILLMKKRLDGETIKPFLKGHLF